MRKLALDTLDSIEQTDEIKSARGVILYNVAYRLTEQRRNDEAEPYYRQALALVSAYGEQWRKNVVLSDYAKLLRSIGRGSEATALEAQIQ